MGKVLDRACEGLAFMAGILLLFTTFTIGYSITTRIINIPNPVWVVQFNEYALLWITFLGTAWLLSNNKHVSVGILFDRLSKKGQRIMSMVHSLVGAALSALLAWYGTFTTWEQYQRGVMDIQVIDIPVAYVIVIIPLGFFLLFLQFAKRFVVILKQPYPEDGHTSDEDRVLEQTVKETTGGGIS